MIITRQPHIPFSWLLMTMVPWVFFYFLMSVGGVNVFVLNRLIDNPAGLTFALSLPGLLFAFVPLGPFISYSSDRIWTRFGRRKVFLIVGFSGTAMVMLSYPLAPNIWVFIGLMFLAAFFGNFNSPFEALKLEITPPAMRGRAAAIGTWITTVVNILFFMTVIGRFDEVIPFMHLSLSGDKIIYWSAATGLLIALFVYLFGIHEMPPHSKITGEKFRLKTMWLALSSPQLRYLYIFGIAAGLLAANLGALGALLYINQWGYSLQEMGFNIAVGGVINLFLIPAIGLLADKGKGHNRMKIWLTCLTLILLLNISYFSYVTWYLPDQRPSLVEIIFFGELTSIVGIVAGVVYYPLVYDYIPRNLMGTYFAGSAILGGISGFITVNGLGLFMLGWAHIFQPPAGEMARICLNQEMSCSEVAGILAGAGLSTPDGRTALGSDIVVRPWFANGIVQESGVCQEIRLRSEEGEKMRKLQDELKKEIDSLEAKNPAGMEKKLAGLRAQNEVRSGELAKRAESWSREVMRALEGKLLQAGEETLGASKGQAAVALLPTLRKARDREVDKLNKKMHEEAPWFVGMRIVNRGREFFLAISRSLPEEEDKDLAIRSACQRVTSLAQTAAPGLISQNAAHTGALVKPAITVDVALVENPLPTFVSPISRVVNSAISLFADVPPPGQKLISLARSLGSGEEASSARVESLPSRNGLRVTKVFDSDSGEDLATLAARLVEKVRAEGASLKLTVPAPLVDKGVVPIKYNYLAGYLYVFTMVLCGFGLVGFFLSKERAGVVRKLGAEEVEAEEAIAEETKLASDASLNPAGACGATYTPGYLMPKLAFAALGVAMVLTAFQQAWPQMRLLISGKYTEAVAVSVCAKNSGQEDEILRTQDELSRKMKWVKTAKDYNWTFFNEFLFEAQDGRQITFRRSVGCKMKPSMQMLDESGLPTTVRILYDEQDPSQTILPLEYSSWFVPALVALFGLIVFLIGSTLAWFAGKPIRIAAD
ncbi:MAG: MFS transporter [Verrucomicrobiae bacterium]